MLDEYFGSLVPTVSCQMRHLLTGECLFPFMFSNHRVLCNLKPFSTTRLSFKLTLLKIETRFGLATSISNVFFSLLFLVYFMTGTQKSERQTKVTFPSKYHSFPFFFVFSLPSFLPSSLSPPFLPSLLLLLLLSLSLPSFLGCDLFNYISNLFLFSQTLYYVFTYSCFYLR